MSKAVLCAIGLSALAGAANAADLPVSIYADGSFTDTGSGFTFFNPPVKTTTITVAPQGFYIEWDGFANEVPEQWRPVQVLKPLPGYRGDVVFAAVLKGEFQVARTGSFPITFGADDGGYLFIDGALVASTPWAHGFYSVTPTVSLSAGAHRFEVEYDNGVCCRAITALSLPKGVWIGAERVAADR
jgi:hypothetical protein